LLSRGEQLTVLDGLVRVSPSILTLSGREKGQTSETVMNEVKTTAVVCALLAWSRLRTPRRSGQQYARSCLVSRLCAEGDQVALSFGGKELVEVGEPLSSHFLLAKKG
jgi:hypothetical protein